MGVLVHAAVIISSSMHAMRCNYCNEMTRNVSYLVVSWGAGVSQVLIVLNAASSYIHTDHI